MKSERTSAATTVEATRPHNEKEGRYENTVEATRPHNEKEGRYEK